MTDLEQAIENVITNLCQRILDLPSAHTNLKYTTHEHTINTYTQAINTLCEAKMRLVGEQSISAEQLDTARDLANRVYMENFRNLANL